MSSFTLSDTNVLNSVSLSKGFSVAHLNARGITSKIDEIKFILSKLNFNILGISETFLKVNSLNNAFQIPDYAIERRDRVSGGGGVMCFIHSSFNYERMFSLENILDESIVLRILPQFQKPFLVSILYRPPKSHSNWKDLFINFVQNCYQICDELVILGDLTSTCPLT
jgi:hypothetical protein